MRTHIIIGIGAIALMLAACTGGSKEERVNLQAANDSLRAVIANQGSEIEEALDILTEIQNGFAQINEVQNRIYTTANGEQTTPAQQQEQIRDNMQTVLETLKSNRERITQLQSTQGIASKALQQALATAEQNLQAATAQIAALQAELEQRNIVIEGMDRDINTLSASVETLNQQRDAQAKELAAQDKSLHTAYFAIGTQKELREMGILEKNEVLKGDYTKDYFTSVDIRNCNSIALYSKKAQLLTNHPEASYSLAKDVKDMLSIQIKDPVAFWSISKYLVVRVW